MGKLDIYSNLSEKKTKFTSLNSAFKIDTVEDFDLWYNKLKSKKLEKSNDSIVESVNTDDMFRGMGEAKYKLFTSAQRFWILNELEQWWSPRGYLEFVSVFVANAKRKLLLKKVFDYYKIASNQRDFPILSILQHYGAPTPLMDWSYSVDVALYFATEDLSASSSGSEIDQYFSIYQIDKNKQKWNEFNNLLDWHNGDFPQIKDFFHWENNHNTLFYISDFEQRPVPQRYGNSRDKPITTLYNQNIIPQEGLFIFNPFSKKPLEDCFNSDHHHDGNNLELMPFHCFNIKKDLAEYIRRQIKINGVDSSFIYPNLRNYCNTLVEEFLDQAAVSHAKQRS